jgi:cytochrome oxidase Cu insertion factor (SCO1/SenC/PrrC family)
MALRLKPDAIEPGTGTNLPPLLAGDLPSISSSKIPDVRVYDQNGKQLNFYSDLVKGRTVAINFIFTTCTGVCPPMTATFRRVQEDLPQRTPPIQLISISVDPATDTPARMHEFAAKFKAGPGWTFVTGDKNEIDLLLQALGAAVANKNDHTPMILIGNEVTDYWTRAYGLSSPTTLIQVITAAANHK